MLSSGNLNKSSDLRITQFAKLPDFEDRQNKSTTTSLSLKEFEIVSCAQLRNQLIAAHDRTVDLILN